MAADSARSPQSPIHGLQAFLRLVRDYDWQNEALIVDVDDDLLEAKDGSNVHRVASANGDGDGRVKSYDVQSIMREVRKYMLENAARRGGAGREMAMTILTPYECVNGLFNAKETRSRVPDLQDMAMLQMLKALKEMISPVCVHQRMSIQQFR